MEFGEKMRKVDKEKTTLLMKIEIKLKNSLE